MASTAALSEESRFSRLSVDEALRRISVDRDSLSDEDHKRLDEKVMNKAFRLTRNQNDTPDWHELLSKITLVDTRLVNLELVTAARLLESNPAIVGILQKAWDGDAFKEVRELGVFLVH
jgi:hypothetical protein